MKEYTVLATSSVIVALVLDRALKVNILKRGEFYFYLLIILFFKFLVNGYLTGSDIVVYNPSFFLGVRIGSIPIEDFLFGFSMVTMTIVWWEHEKRGVS